MSIIEASQYGRFHRGYDNPLRETLSDNTVEWRTSMIWAYFEDSIFNGSIKIQWQEKSFHYMEGHFFIDLNGISYKGMTTQTV